MSHDEPTDNVDGIEAYVQALVAAGYDDRQTIIECGRDYLVDEGGEDAAPLPLPVLVDRLIASQIAAQQSWPQVTDCDRLDTAFTKLEASGIVARQNFACCQTCGFAEIGAEVDDVTDAGGTVRGITFFHQQDTEGAVAGHSLHLSYGAMDDKGDACVIARDVVAALNREGLQANWDGTSAQRIEVVLNWQRRFPATSVIAPHIDPVTGKRDLWTLFGLRRPKR